LPLRVGEDRLSLAGVGTLVVSDFEATAIA
jgi:hypothetical protein